VQVTASSDSNDSNHSTDSENDSDEWGAESRFGSGAMNKGRARRKQRREQRAEDRPPAVLPPAPPAKEAIAAQNAEMLATANGTFEQFSRSERKDIAIRAYYAVLNSRAAVMDAVYVASMAASVAERTIYAWVADYEVNHGFFSPALWGKNTKTPSLMTHLPLEVR
jgi:hypothetical protein